MPDASIGKAASSLIEQSPVWGSIVVILCAVVVFMYWRNSEAQKALLNAKQEHLNDIKKSNEITEQIKGIIVPLISSIESMKTVLEILKDRTKP